MADKINEEINEETVNTSEVNTEVTKGEEAKTSEPAVVEEEKAPAKKKKRWVDDLSDDELEILRRVAANAKSFIPANDKETRRELRGTSVISDDSEEELNTADALKQDTLDLNAAAHSGRVLEGRIIRCRRAGDSNVSTTVAVVKYGNGTIPVLIPSYLLFNYEVKDIRDPNREEKIERRVSRMIGTDIKFVVKQFDQATKTAYADRLKALEQEGYNNYIRHLASTDKPRVKVGDIVKAQIMAVYRTKMIVCALGSETTIYQDYQRGITEASWFHLSDLNMKFKKNDFVYCKVLSLQRVTVEKYGEKYDMVVSELSAKRVEPNPQEKYFDHYREGEYCECVITNVSETANGIYGVIDGGGQVNVMIAFPKYGEMPNVGDRRTIKITGKITQTADGKTEEADGSPVRRIYAVMADT